LVGGVLPRLYNKFLLQRRTSLLAAEFFILNLEREILVLTGEKGTRRLHKRNTLLKKILPTIKRITHLHALPAKFYLINVQLSLRNVKPEGNNTGVKRAHVKIAR
jgi:hypothetical protein